VKNTKGEIINQFDADEPIIAEIHYQVKQELAGCQIGVRVYNVEGIVVLSTADTDQDRIDSKPRKVGRYITRFTIPSYFLPPGTYWLHVAAHAPYRRCYEVVEHAVAFDVSAKGWLGAIDGRLGIVSPLLQWEEISL
jgi:hypothetical protein